MCGNGRHRASQNDHAIVHYHGDLLPMGTAPSVKQFGSIPISVPRIPKTMINKRNYIHKQGKSDGSLPVC